MSKTVDKIRKMSNEAAAKKIAEENERIQKSVDQDLAVLERILIMVKDNLIYKEIKNRHSNRSTYLVVTEEIVLEDYANKPEYGSGTSIKEVAAGYYTYRHTLITVNGHKYYHAIDLITRYKYEAAKAMKKAEAEYDAARARKEAIGDMEGLEPVIKSLMLNFNKHLLTKEVEEV